MATHYRTHGFILEKKDIGEADRIFTAFTEDFGKLDLLARAERKIKSKLRGGLETFYLSEIEFIQGKAYKTLTDTILVNDFKNLRKDLKRLAIAYKISEVLDSLVKGEEPDKKIWQLLNETFERLNTLEIRNWKLGILYYYYFLWNLLSILGYQPELHHCSLCQKKLTPESIFFASKDGGLICGQCKKTIKSAKEVNANAVKIIRLLLKQDWPTLEKLKVEDEDLKQVSAVSRDYLSEILEQIG